MKAIQVRFLGATNFHGARMKAFVSASKEGSVTLPFQYEIGDDESRALQMALELMMKLNWVNVEISGIGQISNGDYVVTLRGKKDDERK